MLTTAGPHTQIQQRDSLCVKCFSPEMMDTMWCVLTLFITFWRLFKSTFLGSFFIISHVCTSHDVCRQCWKEMVRPGCAFSTDKSCFIQSRKLLRGKKFLNNYVTRTWVYMLNLSMRTGWTFFSTRTLLRRSQHSHTVYLHKHLHVKIEQCAPPHSHCFHKYILLLHTTLHSIL